MRGTATGTREMVCRLRAGVDPGWVRVRPGYARRVDRAFLAQMGTRTLSTTAPRAAERDEEAEAPARGGWGILGWLDRKFGAHTAVAAEGTNRWAMVVPAFITHLCIGAPYAWSVVSGHIVREQGFVAPAAGDWSLSEATLPISLVFALHGLSAATLGKWQMKVGPRVAMGLAAMSFGGGLALGGLGIATHQLWLLYLGYGVLGGVGVGLSYTPPVQTLVSWFPDRRGLASGLTIAGFGSGALIFTPAVEKLMSMYSRLPTFVGPTDQVQTTVEGGRLLAEVGGSLQEVVAASSADLAKLPYDLAEGYYLVGSGATGAAPALAIAGGAYFLAMLASAATIRNPPPGYVPEGYAPPAAAGDKEGSSPAPAVASPGSSIPPGRNVSVDTVMKTPQYWLLGTTFFAMATGGMGMLSVAKPMVGDIFSSSLPGVVTASFASSYLLAISSGNLGGRLAWAALSDRIGRRNTFHLFTLGSIPLYLGVPYMVDYVVESKNAAVLGGFVASTTLAVSIMGGTYAIMPAYESDLFGSKYVGANHGRFLLWSTAAALAGPSLLLALRSRSEQAALEGLLQNVDPARFHGAFGAPLDRAQELIEAKSLTISRLMEIMPEGTPDPSPFVYDTTMYAMTGLMGVAALSHALVRPADPKYYEPIEDDTNGDSKR